MSEHTFKGHVGVGPKVRGPALVAGDDFSARYDLDRLNGVFSRPAHSLYGQSYVGCVLVLNTAKGGVATSWMLYEMKSRDMSPVALLLNTANPVIAQGAALADVALVDRFEIDIPKVIQTGHDVDVDPAEGMIIVRR